MRTLTEILQNDSLEEFLAKCYLDFKLFAERVFGYELKDFHVEWLNLVHKNRFVALSAFRGAGKSTIFGEIYPIWLIWHKPSTHILFTAAELGQAIKLLDTMRDTIENNELLRDLMPSDTSITWKKTELKTTNRCHIYAKAYTRHIKGVHVNYCFCDEIQDCVDRDIFRKSIAPTVNLKKGRLVACGTPESPVDLLAELNHNSQYVSKSYPVLITPGISRWPEKFSIKELEEIRKRDGEASFQTQYLLNPMASSEGAVYLPEHIANCFDYTEKFGAKKYDESITIIGADFAVSAGSKADFDAYVVLEKISGKTILRHGERHKGLPKDAKLQRLKDLFDKYNPLRIIIDPSSIGEAIFEDLRTQGYPVTAGEFHSRARNKLLVNLVTMIQPDKSGKSQLVIPRDPNDELTMTFTNKLIEELISFKEQKSQATGMTAILSTGAHDDTVMALALACQAASQQRAFLDMIAI